MKKNAALLNRGAVMIVDNEPAALSVMMRIVLTGGYTPLPCRDMADVRSYFASSLVPLVVVTDVALDDGETGMAVYEFVQKTSPSTPVIFVSGYDNVRIPVSSRLLLKPFGVDEFLSAISDACGQSTCSRVVQR